MLSKCPFFFFFFFFWGPPHLKPSGRKEKFSLSFITLTQIIFNQPSTRRSNLFQKNPFHLPEDNSGSLAISVENGKLSSTMNSKLSNQSSTRRSNSLKEPVSSTRRYFLYPCNICRKQAIFKYPEFLAF